MKWLVAIWEDNQTKMNEFFSREEMIMYVEKCKKENVKVIYVIYEHGE